MSKEDHIKVSLGEVSKKIPSVKNPIIQKIGSLLAISSGSELTRLEVQKAAKELIEIHLEEIERIKDHGE